MSLGPGEKKALELALVGDDPVLRRLRRQVIRVDTLRRHRMGPPRHVLGRQPHLVVHLAVQPDPGLSIGERPGFTGLFDLVVFLRKDLISVSLGVEAGFVHYLSFDSRSRRRVPSPVPEFTSWGYKQCDHWDAACSHLGSVEVSQTRRPFNIDACYPGSKTARPDAPAWLSQIVPGRLPDERAMSDLRRRIPALPADYAEFLMWTDGAVVGGFDLFQAPEVYVLETPSSTEKYLAIGTDIAGDLLALELRSGAVVVVSHDPQARERVAVSFRAWLSDNGG